MAARNVFNTGQNPAGYQYAQRYKMNSDQQMNSIEEMAKILKEQGFFTEDFMGGTELSYGPIHPPPNPRLIPSHPRQSLIPHLTRTPTHIPTPTLIHTLPLTHTQEIASLIPWGIPHPELYVNNTSPISEVSGGFLHLPKGVSAYNINMSGGGLLCMYNAVAMSINVACFKASQSYLQNNVFLAKKCPRNATMSPITSDYVKKAVAEVLVMQNNNNFTVPDEMVHRLADDAAVESNNPSYRKDSGNYDKAARKRVADYFAQNNIEGGEALFPIIANYIFPGLCIVSMFRDYRDAARFYQEVDAKNLWPEVIDMMYQMYEASWYKRESSDPDQTRLIHLTSLFNNFDGPKTLNAFFNISTLPPKTSARENLTNINYIKEEFKTYIQDQNSEVGSDVFYNIISEMINAKKVKLQYTIKVQNIFDHRLGTDIQPISDLPDTTDSKVSTIVALVNTGGHFEVLGFKYEPVDRGDDIYTTCWLIKTPNENESRVFRWVLEQLIMKNMYTDNSKAVLDITKKRSDITGRDPENLPTPEEDAEAPKPTQKRGRGGP